MDRVILHCDMNCFYASVELLDYPQLANKPMAVCGNPKNRHGIILAKNQLAKDCGVLTAETIWQAKKKCPDLVCVPPHMNKYKEYSRAINEIYLSYTNLVEAFSIDESWLDVTGSQRLFGSGLTIANLIRQRVKRELGLTLSAGVSYNKVFAKMGSEYKKPDATTAITRDNYKDVLWHLPVSELFFVGKVSATKLNKIGIKTIGDLAMSEERLLIRLLGKHGHMLFNYANGLDTSEVVPATQQERIKSLGHGVTFTRNLLGEEDMLVAVAGLCDKVTYRLRKLGLRAGGIKIDVKDPNFHSISRQKQFLYASQSQGEFAMAAMALLRNNWPMDKPIRLLTITGIQLCQENVAEQLSLFASEEEARTRLAKIDTTIDLIRDKFGDDSISLASTLKNDIGLSKLGDSEEDPFDPI